MKGWSFNGLVKALKTAAFKDVGAAVGQVPLVGDEGMLSAPKVLNRADFNNIDYKSGAVYRINPPYTNWPFDSFLDKKQSWFVCVDVGQGLSGACSLRILNLGSWQPVCLAQRDGNAAWSYRPFRASRPIGNLTPDKLNSKDYYGDWIQTNSGQASPNNGYPVQMAGILSVYESPYGVVQEYTVYSGGKKYTRNSLSGGAFSAWVCQVNYENFRVGNGAISTVPSSGSNLSRVDIKFNPAFPAGSHVIVAPIMNNGMGRGALSCTAEAVNSNGFSLVVSVTATIPQPTQMADFSYIAISL